MQLMAMAMGFISSPVGDEPLGEEGFPACVMEEEMGEKAVGEIRNKV